MAYVVAETFFYCRKFSFDSTIDNCLMYRRTDERTDGRTDGRIDPTRQTLRIPSVKVYDIPFSQIILADERTDGRTDGSNPSNSADSIRQSL